MLQKISKFVLFKLTFSEHNAHS